MTLMTDTEKWQAQKDKVDRFVSRFGNEAYRLLVYHAALPLVLTPELVNYLRNEFLRGEEVPWEAEVDLLLSDLCSQVGYELYAMDTQVRAYLLEDIQDAPFWQQRMREVAQVLISYVNFLSRMNPEQRQQELDAQRLAAMVYLGDETCQQAAQEIAERLQQVSYAAEAGELSERGVRAELARLTRITQELAPQLQNIPSLVEYAKLVQRVLRNPEAVDPAELQHVYQVGEVALTVDPKILPVGSQTTEDELQVVGFPDLQPLEFETGQLVEQDSHFPPLQTQTVESVTLVFDHPPMSPQTQTELTLFPLRFEVATIERDSHESGAWTIKRRQGEAHYFAEPLGDHLSLDMVEIPSGVFVMGSPQDEPERYTKEAPQHEVQISSFYMGRYLVTQAQWRFIAELAPIDRELDPDPSRFKEDTRPVEQVSWLDALEFCNRLSRLTGKAYRLPSEAEWEYACRAGTTTPFHFGETISPELANYAGSESYNNGPKGEFRQETTDVDHFGIANAFGLCDMHGNVREWCLDHWHDNYEVAPSDGSAWFSEDENANRVIRGGSWDYYPRGCRSAFRDQNSPGYHLDDLGFRVICVAPRTL